MTDIALFPLPIVLFPGGRTSLQVVEPRYIDLVRHCMREDTGFGVVLIKQGPVMLQHPEQQLPEIAHCGTYCRIVDFDQLDNGFLQITVLGEGKFSIREEYETPDRLMMASVEFLPIEAEARVPENKQHLVSLLESLTTHESVKDLGLVVNYEDASDVSGRLSELLPCSNDFKQRLLEIRNSEARLNELEKLVIKLQNTEPY